MGESNSTDKWNPLNRPSGHQYFKHTLHIFSLVAAAGFLLTARTQPFNLSSTLLATAVPAMIFFLLLQFVLYLRSHLRWLILRHILDTFLKVGFLLALAPLIHFMVIRGWLTPPWGLVIVLVGILVVFVLWSWGVEVMLKRLFGERIDEETDLYEEGLKQLDALPRWKIALMMIPDLKKPGSSKPS